MTKKRKKNDSNECSRLFGMFIYTLKIEMKNQAGVNKDQFASIFDASTQTITDACNGDVTDNQIHDMLSFIDCRSSEFYWNALYYVKTNGIKVEKKYVPGLVFFVLGEGEHNYNVRTRVVDNNRIRYDSEEKGIILDRDCILSQKKNTERYDLVIPHDYTKVIGNIGHFFRMVRARCIDSNWGVVLTMYALFLCFMVLSIIAERNNKWTLSMVLYFFGAALGIIGIDNCNYNIYGDDLRYIKNNTKSFKTLKWMEWIFLIVALITLTIIIVK